MKRENVVIGMKVVLKKKYRKGGDDLFYTFDGEVTGCPKPKNPNIVLEAIHHDEEDDFTFKATEGESYQEAFSCKCVKPYRGVV